MVEIMADFIDGFRFGLCEGAVDVEGVFMVGQGESVWDKGGGRQGVQGCKQSGNNDRRKKRIVMKRDK